MIVYISGPISGLPHLNFWAFRKAEKQLKREGHVPLNPRSIPLGLTYESYMDIAMAQVRAADAIYRLPGWKQSGGAQAEVAYAVSLKKKILGAPE